MVKRVLCGLIAPLALAESFDDAGLSLLQTNVHSQDLLAEAESAGVQSFGMAAHETFVTSNATSASGSGDVKFGCQSTMIATEVLKCSFWGEPHASKTFVETKQGFLGIWGIFDRIGLYRLAWAKDKSWEVQMYSCGLQMAAIAVKFNDTLLEVVNTHYSRQEAKFYLNGQEVTLPLTPAANGVLWNKDMRQRHSLSAHGWSYSWGTCMDSPDGHVQIEITNQRHPKVRGTDPIGNMLGMYMIVDKDVVPIGKDVDPNALCNRGTSDGGRGDWRRRFRADKAFDHVGLTQVPLEEAIFSPERNVCGSCKFALTKQWRTRVGQQFDAEGEARCVKLAPPAPPTPTSEEACERNNIPMAQAEASCKKLKTENEAIYADCIFDCCMSTPDTCKAAAENAENEEQMEDPHNECLMDAANCDTEETCRKAKTMKLTNVVTNNLDGSGEGPLELRYGTVLTRADGVKVDLVVTTDNYASVKSNSQNGLNGKLGQLNIDCGSSYSFKFKFVVSGTDTKTNPTVAGDTMIFSFLDIDQGKRNKGRSSVEVCGADEVIVSTNSELEKKVDNQCTQVTSTVRGTAKDNPDDPAMLSEQQKARTASFVLGQSSEFEANLGVGKCSGGRNFMFTGNPAAVCV